MLLIKVALILLFATLTGAWKLTVFYDEDYRHEHQIKSEIYGNANSGCKLLPLHKKDLRVDKVKLEAQHGETWGVVLYTDNQCLDNPVSVPMGETKVADVKLKTYFLFRVGPQ